MLLRLSSNVRLDVVNPHRLQLMSPVRRTEDERSNHCAGNGTLQCEIAIQMETLSWRVK